MFFYPFNVGDYIAHTAHLSENEDLAYRRLIDWCYLHEKRLPENTEQIARLIRMPLHCSCIANVLNEFFILENGTWGQQRIADEIAKYHSKGAKAAENASKRWHKPEAKQALEPKEVVNAKAMQVQCSGNAKQKQKQEIINNKQVLTPTAEAVVDFVPFEYFWRLYKRKQAKIEAQKIWLAMKPNQELFEQIKTHLLFAYSAIELNFVPMPTTYLNQKRWLDEILPTEGTVLRPSTFQKPKDDFVERHTNRDWAKNIIEGN